MRRDLARLDHPRLEPVHEPGPVVRPHEDDGEARHLAGLHEDEGLEELVERAETTRHEDEALGVLHEHRLADEEVAEVDADVDVGVQALLERQLDPEPDRGALGLDAPAVGSLHDTRPAAGDDGVPGLRELGAELPRELVLGVVARRAGGPEHGDGGADLGEQAEALDELGLDAQHAPGVGVHPVGRSGAVQQPLVGGSGLGEAPAQDDRPPVPLRFASIRRPYLPPRSHLRQSALRGECEG